MLAPLVTLIFVTAGASGTISMAATLRQLRPALARLAADRRAFETPRMEHVIVPSPLSAVPVPSPRELPVPPRQRKRSRIRAYAVPKPIPYRALLQRPEPLRQRG